jgi:hypothetical protein
MTDDQIVVNYASNHSMLSTVFKVHSDDGGYEQYTKLLHNVPRHQQEQIAREAISGEVPFK